MIGVRMLMVHSSFLIAVFKIIIYDWGGASHLDDEMKKSILFSFGICILFIFPTRAQHLTLQKIIHLPFEALTTYKRHTWIRKSFAIHFAHIQADRNILIIGDEKSIQYHSNPGHSEKIKNKNLRYNVRTKIYIINKDRKIIYQNNISPKLHINPATAFFFEIGIAYPCSYGLVYRPQPKLICFQGDLSIYLEREIPLGRVFGVHVVPGENGPEIWIFGRHQTYRKNIKYLRTDSKHWKTKSQNVLSPNPEATSFQNLSFGVIYDIEKDMFKPMPLQLDEIVSALETFAKNTWKRTVHFKKKRMVWYPVRNVKGRLLLIVGLNERSENQKGDFENSELYQDGNRYYFFVDITGGTIGKIARIPIEIHPQIKNRIELKEHKNEHGRTIKGILKLPPFYRAFIFRVFSLGHERYFFWNEMETYFMNEKG